MGRKKNNRNIELKGKTVYKTVQKTILRNRRRKVLHSHLTEGKPEIIQLKNKQIIKYYRDEIDFD